MISPIPMKRYADWGLFVLGDLSFASSPIGIDLGRHGFYLHGRDASGEMVFSLEVLAPPYVHVAGQYAGELISGVSFLQNQTRSSEVSNSLYVQGGGPALD